MKIWSRRRKNDDAIGFWFHPKIYGFVFYSGFV